MGQEKIILKIKGMSCGQCKMNVEKAFRAIPRVVNGYSVSSHKFFMKYS